MKAVVALVFGLAALSAAHVVDDDRPLVNMDVKEKQIVVLKLLNHVMEPVMYKEIENIGKNFKIEDNIDLFVKQDVVKTFISNLKLGFLPRGEVFTLHIDRQMEEVIKMFHMMYYAKDFKTFIKTACWMRLHLNEGMFVYALTVAVRHREDCKGIILPPPYEIYPYFFVRADVIQKAYMVKMKKGLLDAKLCDFYGIQKTDKDIIIIDENIYDRRMYLNDEDKLRYFTEDIGLNTYYYYFHIDYPFWMKDDVLIDTFTVERGEIKNIFKARRWELTSYVYQQILARYYLERLSIGLGDITSLNWNKKIRKGYWPWIILHNGVQLPLRLNNHNTVDDRDIPILTLVKDYEKIINEAIIKGFVEINGMRLELTKHDDVETLGKLIYGGEIDKTTHKTKFEAYHYMLILMQTIVGLNTWFCDKYFAVPGVLDNYQTALRDPVFYQLQKRLTYSTLLFKLRLPSYTHEDLLFKGVKINNVFVDKLVTYFDDYLMDMTTAVTLNQDEIQKAKSDLTFLVRKRRLNHHPFKVVLDIESENYNEGFVRIFLGPKEDHLGRLLDLNINRINFVELDSFIYTFYKGKNSIVRKSTDMHNLVGDRLMTRDLWEKMDTITNVENLLNRMDLRNYHTGFPSRLLLPRGRIGGMKMILYVVVTQFKPVDNALSILDAGRKDYYVDFRSSVLIDKMPLGFPFDRHIDINKFFTPNMKFLDVVIYHKKEVCDMKTRWDRYVLKDYNPIDRTSIENNFYFLDVNMNTKFDTREKHLIYNPI